MARRFSALSAPASIWSPNARRMRPAATRSMSPDARAVCPQSSAAARPVADRTGR